MSPRPYKSRLGQSLSQSEIEVLQLMSQGMVIKSIANARFTSARTVECQLRVSRAKTGCKTNEQMMVWAERRGLLRQAPASNGHAEARL